MESFITNLTLKFPKSIKRFFISSIGPSTKKDSIEPVVNLPRKVLAINASASEHTDNVKAKKIITIIERKGLPPKDVRISFGIRTLNKLEIKA